MMKQISFETVYDKSCEELANLLETLVSKHVEFRSIKRELKQFHVAGDVVSDEYVLTIGKKSSKVNQQNFQDKYCNFGIHIGYYGRKAWISCDKIKWNIELIDRFIIQLAIITDEIGGLKVNLPDRLKQTFEKTREERRHNANVKTLVAPNQEWISFASVTCFAILNPLLSIITNAHSNIIMRIITQVHWRNHFLKDQYQMAILIFFTQFLNDFLGLAEEE